MTPVSSMLRSAPAYGEPPVPLPQLLDGMERDIPGLTSDDVLAAVIELTADADGGPRLVVTDGPGGPLYARTPLGDAALAATAPAQFATTAD